jgi:hypothetical protein
LVILALCADVARCQADRLPARGANTREDRDLKEWLEEGDVLKCLPASKRLMEVLQRAKKITPDMSDKEAINALGPDATRRARRQRDAVAALRKKIAWIYYGWEPLAEQVFGRGIRGKDSPEGPPVPDWLLKRLGDEYFQEVVAIGMDGLRENELTKYAPLLKSFPALQRLALHRLKISDEGLKSVVRSCPNLKWLSLSLTDVTDRQLVVLQKLPRLETLVLEGTRRITGEGLGHLRGCKKLHTLSIADTNLGDDAMEQVGRLQTLRVLYIGRTKVGPRGLSALAPLRKLTWLDVEQLRLASAQVKAFVKSHPDCMVMGRLIDPANK